MFGAGNALISVSLKKKNAVRRVNTSPVNTNRDALLENAPQLNTAVHMPDRRSLNAGQDKEQFKSPVMLHPVSADLDEVQLLPPDPRRIQRAYHEAGFEYAGSDSKKRSLLKESNERYSLQRRLSTYMQDEEVLIVKTDISVKKAMEINDSELVRNYNSYEGGGVPYVNVRYRLIRNRYYAVLPVKEMRKLERKDLLSRLRAEYEKPVRNADLIEFYADLICLREYEDAQNEKKKHRDNPENPPAAIGAQELRHNQAGYNRNRDRIRGLHISNEEKTARIEAMSRVMSPVQGRHFWQDDKTHGLSPEQEEGARAILAWMYRNCNKSSQSKEPFVYRLTQADPRQLLFMFYIIENDMDPAPDMEYAHKAMTSYIPDLSNFKEKVIASKAKFWKRIGSDTSDSVINWSRLAAAARVVLTSDIVSDYLTYNDEAERIQSEIDKPENEEQKEDLYYDLLLQKGNLLLTLYRSAGLSPDMPPDLIAQPELRQKAKQLITEFTQGLEQISELQNGQAGNPAGTGEPAGVRKKEGKDFEREGKKSVREDAIAGSQSGDAWKTINEVKDFTSGTAVSINSLLKTIGAPVRDVTDNLSYNLAVSGIGAATSIVGLIAGFVSAVKLARTGAKLTGADHVSRAFSVSSQILKSTGAGTQGAFAIVDKFAGISGNAGNAASNVPWYGSTAARSVSETFSTVSGATQFCVGTLLLVGGTFQAASGYIEAGRTLSAQKAARKARLAILRESRAGTELTKEKQKEREQLKLLLKHQDRVAVTQGKTATVKAIGGSLTMMGGTFTMTGLLAPIGGIMAAVGSILHIGLGLIYARNKRNLTRRQAVDDALNLDSVIYTLKQSNPALRTLSKKKQEELKAEIRQEALGELGYATYKEAFSDLSKKNAVLLYHHVFEMPEGTEEYNMFYETLKSLGLKIRKAGDGQKNNLPTLQMIYAKLMG